MVWCPATVTATRIVNEEGLDDGFVEYRVHYEGSSSSSISAPAPAETKAATASKSETAEDPSDGRGIISTVKEAFVARGSGFHSSTVTEGAPVNIHSSTVTEAALVTPPESTTLLSEGDAIEEGVAVSALDVRRVWCDAHVVKLRWQKAKSKEPHVTAVKLRFEGWDPKWDEWVLLNSGKQTGTSRPAPTWSSHARPNLGAKLMSQPAALPPAAPSGFSPPAAVKGATLSSLPSGQLHQLLKAMQLFREDAVVLAPNSFNPANMLIRLKLTASASVYVGAQIVSLQNDEVQVRGIEGAPTPIQRTKMQYVSNQPFSEMELACLEFKLRNQIVKDVSLADAEQATQELMRIRLLLPPPPPKAH
ncbi:hypothetical protein Ctob_011905 [Chrysochromulina tobinii]|uniref:Uncharacterized protein n=1 Tax=Chrysochromulina tobinii TaxID=1460289 RepID=A0A0M0JYN8_9EUKA|nr:hypothetical protein Ctob_011905 [Chrysochromulina tobinii]|eukprot:KOO31766.1 hypothetical protein Ctob_011905 [Chrysochromulina sp. CCMP291]